MNNNKPIKDKEVDQYAKKGFISKLPFGVKASFIKYWFYGALYFFCFMGLGLTGIKNENLVLVTGLIGGVLFDIALYNIFLLFAESREEASNWWFFKSKKFYSIFINILVITGMMFAFYYIIVPIKIAIGDNSPFWWLFQEPLSAALLLLTLDSGIVWAKNLIIILIKKIFKLDKKKLAAQENYIKLLDISPISVTFELNESSPYYSTSPYNVLLDNEIIFKKVKTNVLTIYDLKPDTQYRLTINRKSVVFTTSKISKFYKVYEGNDIQKVLDYADQYSLIVVNKGTYNIKSLIFKNNIVLYIRKGAKLISSSSLNDYPFVSTYHSLNKNDEIAKIRQAVFHIDHLNEVKIICEGSVEYKLNDSIKNTEKDKLPNLIFINQSSNITLIGLTINNLSYGNIYSFYSNNINLLNLNVTNSKNYDAFILDHTSNINLSGNHITNSNNSIIINANKISSNTDVKEISIRNSLIENSNTGIAITPKIGTNLSYIKVSHCVFSNIKTGINLDFNMNKENENYNKDFYFNNISMDNVLLPFVFNVYNEHKLNPNEISLNYLVNINFTNINAKNYEYCAGLFNGLSKKFIKEIKISDSSFMAKTSVNGCDYKLNDKTINLNRNGFIVKNVKSFNLKNVKLMNFNGKKIESDNVGEIIDD